MFETTVGALLLALAVSQLWGMLMQTPRLVSRLELLETRRVEDRTETDRNTQTLELLKISVAESNIKFLNLFRQCEEDRAINRQMHQDWTKSQKELGEAVVDLRSTLTMINQTLLHSTARRTRREED